MQGAVSSPLIIAPGVTGGFTGTPAGAGGLALLVLAVSTIATQRLSLGNEVWAGPVTWFPHLQTVISTKVISFCANFSTEVEFIIMEAGPITRFPLFQAVLPAHVESLILCAEVRTGDGGSAVIIAETRVCSHTRTVHLGGAHCSIIWVGDT